MRVQGAPQTSVGRHTVHRKSLLSQLVAKAVDCWSKYLQEQDIGQRKEKE